MFNRLSKKFDEKVAHNRKKLLDFGESADHVTLGYLGVG